MINGKAFDISAILLAHEERELVVASIKSLIQACNHAKYSGLTVEIIVCLDSPDAATEKHVETALNEEAKVFKVQYGDQGKARNRAVSKAAGESIAFLDGDDLWSFNWLTEAWGESKKINRDTIIHPEFNWFFEDSDNLFVQMDQRDPRFDGEYLRVGNYWDALCYSSKKIYEKFPYVDREVDIGFAFEDWDWNKRTYEEGILHCIAPSTIHFKRRRKNSQHGEATSRRVSVRPTKLSAYEYFDRNR